MSAKISLINTYTIMYHAYNMCLKTNFECFKTYTDNTIIYINML